MHMYMYGVGQRRAGVELLELLLHQVPHARHRARHHLDTLHLGHLEPLALDRLGLGWG